MQNSTFVHYLYSCKQSAVENKDQPLRIAIGNTSGDMDSIVGAMGLAYYLTLKTKQLWTPVINCAAKDLKLKTEIYCHLIEDCGLNHSDMFFWDELLESGRPIEEIALIDHNVLAEEQVELLGNEAHSKVTYVYDHHVDTKSYPQQQLKDYQVRFIGSACSILVLLMKGVYSLYDTSLFDKESKVNFAYFLGAAVVLDAHNFAEYLRQRKWTSEDEEARDWLAQFTSLGQAYYEKMESNKHNAQIALDLGFQGNLRRDYKQYRLAKDGHPGTFGIAALVCDLDSIFERYGHDQVCKEINEHMAEQQLSLFGIMFNVMNEKTHVVERAIFVYTRHDSYFASSFDSFLATCKSSDLLRCGEVQRGTYESCEYATIPLGNNTVSRKKWEIVFRAFYQ